MLPSLSRLFLRWKGAKVYSRISPLDLPLDVSKSSKFLCVTQSHAKETVLIPIAISSRLQQPV